MTITARILAISFFLININLVFASDDAGEPVIRSITIIRENVFTSTDNPLGIAYPFGNKIRFLTRESVIRQELLFSEGEQLDPDLLRETERNLRKLEYIASAYITHEKNLEGGVDITVRTQDLWSTIIGVVTTRREDKTNYGLLVEEMNVLGYGKSMTGNWRRSPTGNSGEINFLESRFLGTRLSVEGNIKIGPQSEYNYTFDIDRPFFSLDAKWSTLATFEFVKSTKNLDLPTEYLETRKTQRLTVSRAFGTRRIKLIPTFGYLHEDASSEDYHETLNEFSAFLRLRNFRFSRMKRIDKFERIEDLELGNSFGFGVANAGEPFGTGRDYFRLTVTQGTRFPVGSRTFIFQHALYTAALESDEWIDRITEFEVKGYSQILPHQTFAVRIQTQFRSDLSPRMEQITLDEEFGLRGYSTDDGITGEKFLLFNVEDRVFTGLKFLTMAFGSVVFLDGGGAWKENESVDLTKMKFSAGIGLRIGLTKSASSRVTRFDFAFPLDGRGINLDNVVFSFATDQVFRLSEKQRGDF